MIMLHIMKLRTSGGENHEVRISIYDSEGKLIGEVSKSFEAGKYFITVERTGVLIKVLSMSSNMITLLVNNATHAKIESDKVIIV